MSVVVRCTVVPCERPALVPSPHNKQGGRASRVPTAGQPLASEEQGRTEGRLDSEGHDGQGGAAGKHKGDPSCKGKGGAAGKA